MDFTSDKVLARFLFERTMDNSYQPAKPWHSCWEDRGVRALPKIATKLWKTEANGGAAA